MIIATGLIFSCDTREDYLEHDNATPTGSISNQTGDRSNSNTKISDSLKLKKAPYTLRLKVNDDGEYVNISYENIQGDSKIRYQGKDINTKEEFEANGELIKLNIHPQKTGDKTIQLYVKDIYEQTLKIEVNLFVFKNLKPTVALTIEKVQTKSQFEARIDATGSFDKDQRWDGKVGHFKFFVDNNYTAIDKDGVINYVFPGKGTYNVHVKVVDNDGGETDSQTKSITFN